VRGARVLEVRAAPVTFALAFIISPAALVTVLYGITVVYDGWRRSRDTSSLHSTSHKVDLDHVH